MMLAALSPPARPTRVAHARLEVALVSGQSTVTAAYAASPLKLLTPRVRAESVWAYLSSFGGGLLAGDQSRVDLRIRAGARCFFSTQSATRVYRNPAGLPCTHQTAGLVEKGALLVFAPDRVQPFAGSSYRQVQEWHLAEGAGLVLLDWYTAGRVARGERWDFEQFQSRNDVFVTGERVFLDSSRLAGGADALRAPHRTGRFHCFAMLLCLGEPCRSAARAILEALSSQPVGQRERMVASASPVRDGCVLRIGAEDSELVSHELERHLQPLAVQLGDNPWIRKW